MLLTECETERMSDVNISNNSRSLTASDPPIGIENIAATLD